MVNRSYNGKHGELRKVFVLDKKYRWCDCSHSCKLETMVNDGKKIYAENLLSSIIQNTLEIRVNQDMNILKKIYPELSI